MKLRKKILILGMLMCTMYMFGYTVHSNLEYANNPELARQDAEWYEEQGDIENALICYKKYAALSGKNTKYISTISERLHNKAYPSWYDSSTMTAVPLSDGKVLIVYNKLMESSVWAIKNNYQVPGISGDWNVKANDMIFNAIKRSNLYIPMEGLYGEMIVDSSSSPTTYLQSGKCITVPDKSESITLYLVSDRGRTKIDCGSYIEKGYLRGGRVYTTKEYTKDPVIVKYYPTRIIKKDKLGWNIDTENKINTKVVDSSVSVSKTRIVTLRRDQVR